jgi:hypothetical protein
LFIVDEVEELSNEVIINEAVSGFVGERRVVGAKNEERIVGVDGKQDEGGEIANGLFEVL